MELQQRINALSKLGQILRDFTTSGHPQNKADDLSLLGEALMKAGQANGWFDRANLEFAIDQWGVLLTEHNLHHWTQNYDFSQLAYKRVGIVAAGNIPLVGFHDLLSVLICGSSALVRLSSGDQYLLPALMQMLSKIEPGFEHKVDFTTDKIQGFDAIIATGSNNTARYFEHYFGAYPHIIRKNRNSVAVLDGQETPDQLQALAQDILRYFGLGCRNVSKLFVPHGYNFDAFFKAIYSQRSVINHHKYMNNYDYNKAVYLMSNIPLLDNEFILLKQDSAYSSPIGVVFYESYQDLEQLGHRLEADRDQIQCIVSKTSLPKTIDFGQAQMPKLTDYADGVDTVDFVLNTSQ